MHGLKEPHAVHALHPEIGHDHLRTRDRQRRERRLPRLHRRHRIARRRQPHRNQLQQVLVVVDEENLRLLVAH